MDPDACLNELRLRGRRDDAERAAEVFDALDRWISKGGFLPEAWQRDERP